MSTLPFLNSSLCRKLSYFRCVVKACNKGVSKDALSHTESLRIPGLTEAAGGHIAFIGDLDLRNE